MKLYDLPQRTAHGVKIYGLHNTEGQPLIIRFGHVDGMYSYCWIDGHDDQVVHLNASTPLVKHEDGYKIDD